jgi:wyosine [tRNA(Phe)-imidazoG37] synthetase (radical SAM superfamily)
MGGFLFHQVVFGPIRSRRLGSSLGINLLPLDHKVCSFDCIYCECGWTPDGRAERETFPPEELVIAALEERLSQMYERGKNMPDSLTFAGNGEPTLHPKFAFIIDQTISLRNRYAPNAKVTVLSNGSTLDHQETFHALQKIDLNIQKLDGGTENTIQLINNPANITFNLEKLLNNLSRFNGNVIIQTLFLQGEVHGEKVDNTTPEEVQEWIRHLKRINPQYVMIYPVERGTPDGNIDRVPSAVLEQIAKHVKEAGIETKVYG